MPRSRTRRPSQPLPLPSPCPRAGSHRPSHSLRLDRLLVAQRVRAHDAELPRGRAGGEAAHQPDHYVLQAVHIVAASGRPPKLRFPANALRLLEDVAGNCALRVLQLAR